LPEGREIALAGHSDARAVLVSPAEPRGTVVLYHGGGNDRWFGFGYLTDKLVGAGFSVLTGHMAGHGAGGSDLFDVEAGRRRVDALLQAARGEIVVLGQSMGGALALDQRARGVHAGRIVTVSAPLCLRQPTKLLLELEVVGGAAMWRAIRWGGLAGALPAYRGFRRASFPVRLAGGKHYLDAFAEALEELDLESRLCATASAAAHGGGPGLRATRDCLVVHGERDGVVPVEQAHRIARALGPCAELCVVPGVHHLDPLLDRDAVSGIVRWVAGGRT